jgi:hypothetical protein
MKFSFLSLILLAAHSAFAGSMLYDAIPDPVPYNLPSLGYQATQTAEFGGLIQFEPGTSRNVWTVNVLLSDWALASTYGSTDPGWFHPITLNLYNVDASSGTPQPGSLIQSVTQTFFIPWRPEASPGCGAGWRAPDNNCYSGMAFEISFALNNLLVPDELIYGVAYNTNTWGANPIGSPGPYESLNFALNTVAPTVGSLPLPDTAYWNTQTAGNYTDGGAGGVGTFRQDTGWTPYNGAVEFTSIPEPGSLLLVLFGAMGLLARRRA